ncbi:hypothetical protein IMSAGC021_00970 [Muribaculaceae bacterium]|nr:hypothetical protein IMSAGC021_00970 [Muribaculaceae bacterium]
MTVTYRIASMKKILILFLLLAGIMPGFAQRSYKLGEVVVRAKRPMKESTRMNIENGFSIYFTVICLVCV